MLQGFVAQQPFLETFWGAINLKFPRQARSPPPQCLLNSCQSYMGIWSPQFHPNLQANVLLRSRLMHVAQVLSHLASKVDHCLHKRLMDPLRSSCNHDAWLGDRDWPKRVETETGSDGAMAPQPGEVAELQISKPHVRAAWSLLVEHKINTGFVLCVHDGFTGSEPNHLETCGWLIRFRIPVKKPARMGGAYRDAFQKYLGQGSIWLSWLVIFFFPYNPPPHPENPPPARPTRGGLISVHFGSVWLRSGPFWLRLAPFRVCVGSVSGCWVGSGRGASSVREKNITTPDTNKASSAQDMTRTTGIRSANQPRVPQTTGFEIPN